LLGVAVVTAFPHINVPAGQLQRGVGNLPHLAHLVGFVEQKRGNNLHDAPDEHGDGGEQGKGERVL
jgi:hypothetical protein